ncbi:MAG: PilZ domain-containing protein [Syntrophaceae bacterium]|nr:PilZ domain-containing protein [Syntrophaceae bacterium]
MKEKRKEKRLKDTNEIAVTVFSREENLLKKKNFNNYSEDISPSGAKFQSNIFLPLGSLLKIDLTLETIHKKISVFGKVKWIKEIPKKRYEGGVEFVFTTRERLKKLERYILWKQDFPDITPSGTPFWVFKEFIKTKKTNLTSRQLKILQEDLRKLKDPNYSLQQVYKKLLSLQENRIDLYRNKLGVPDGLAEERCQGMLKFLKEAGSLEKVEELLSNMQHGVD